MKKNSKSACQASPSSKGNERVRMGGSNFGGHSAKSIKHGVGGRQLRDTEHNDRMGHTTQDEGMY